MKEIQSFRDVCKIGASAYYGELPFHNFAHASSVEQRAYELTQLLQLDQITTQGIILGARMHDAGYHLQTPSEFPTKEDYSIHLMKKVATEELASLYPRSIYRITAIATHGIQGTKLDCTEFFTEARKILRAADIPNLGNPDETVFFEGSAKIYHEINILYKEKLEQLEKYPFPIDEFQESQIPLLTKILENTQKSLVEDRYFFSGYYANFRKNIALCLSDDFQKYVANQNPNR